MRLTKFSDYALRVLLMAASRPGGRVTIEETARQYGISASHLKKVVRLLAHEGLLVATRGKAGGYALGRPPQHIRLGEVLRVTEPDFGLVECFLPSNACCITPHCRLPRVINEALFAFIEVFDRYTLADVEVAARHFERASAAHSQAPLPLRGPRLPEIPET